MTECIEQDWGSIAESLAKQYGNDAAQEAVCRTLEAIASGKTVNDAYTYGVRAAQNYLIDVGKSRSRNTMVSLDALTAAIDRGMPPPSALLDESNPEDTAAISEYEQRKAALQAEYYQRCATGSPSLRQYWRQQYQAALERIG